MDIWLIVVLVVHVLTALAIIGLVLLQHGKGADMGAAFGGGASGSVFGATGSANFLSRTTAVFAVIFFSTSLGLAYLATHRPTAGGGVMDVVKEQPSVPGSSIPGQSEAAQGAVPGAQPATTQPATAKGDAASSKANEVPK